MRSAGQRLLGRARAVRLVRRHLPFFLVALALIISQGIFIVYSLRWSPESLPASAHGQFKSSRDHNGRNTRHVDNAKKQGAADAATPLPFKSSCALKGAEIMSALNRARTEQCKRQMVDLFCKHQRDELYPSHLNNECPIKDGDSGESLGCFRLPADAKLQTPQYVANNSLVRQTAASYPDEMSCVWACLRIGAPIAVYASTTPNAPCACSKVFDENWERLGDQCSGTPDCSQCSTLLKTGLPQHPKEHQPILPLKTVGADLPRVRIAFLLTVNGRAVRQVRRLIAALKGTSSRRHFFYIHVDQRQDYLYNALKALEDPSWLRVSSQRFSTIWGGASLLQMLLHCFHELLLQSSEPWDYVINLSETDFPVKRIDELEVFLGENKGYNFVRSHGQDTPKFISKQALTKTFFECETRMWRLGDRELPRGIRIDGGSDWVALHRGFVQWLIDNRPTDPLLVGLESLFRYSLLPAESFFHTVLRNSGFCSLLVDNNLRFVNWRRKQGCKCQYKHVVDWCGCSPNVILEDDAAKVAALSKKAVFFARKFEPVLSQKIVDLIEEKMLRLKRPPTSNPSSETSYWQNEFLHLDRSPPTDQGRLSAWTSLARLSARQLGQLGSRCVLRASRVLETWLYFEEDRFKGVIIQYEAHAEHLSEAVKVEALLSPSSSFKRSGKFENDPFDERLRRIEVSSDFDVKELFFRNFAGILGPQSEPGVLHEWDRGVASSVTFVWIDPAQIVAGSYELKVSASEQIQHHKPPLKKPLRPGVWTLKMFKDWILMAETSFVVVPQSHVGGFPVKNATVASQLNGGPVNGYTTSDLTGVENFLGISRATKQTLLREATSRSHRTGADLAKWVDSLVFPRWSIEGICFVANPAHPSGGVFCPQLNIEPCHYTTWSSLAPDAKQALPAD